MSAPTGTSRGVTQPVPTLQRRLRVGAATDPLEAEADAVADRVLRMPVESMAGEVVQRCLGGCPGEDELRRQPADSGHRAGAAPLLNAATASRLEAARGGGQPLPGVARRFFEPRFSTDLSPVRVHTDDRAAGLAAQINARAFTVGRDVFFGAGQLRPGTREGDRLLAHELTHTVQQGAVRGGAAASNGGATGGSETVQRQGDEGFLGGGGAGGGAGASWTLPADVPSIEPEPPEMPADVPAEGPVELRREPVERIVMSCDDDLIAFHTLTTTYLYELAECQAPIGQHTADVHVTGNRVRFLFPDVPESGGRLFRFRFNVRRGQENPATLLSTQERVPFHVVASMPRQEEPERETGDRCVISIPGRTLLEAQRFSRPLFDSFSRTWNLWEKDIPLAEFGWVSVVLDADASARGTLTGRYGPLVLRDVCLVRSLGGGRFAGDAQIDLPASLRARIDLEGGLELRGEWLSVVPMGSAEGRVGVTGTAGLSGRGRGRLEVIYDNTTGDWAFAAGVDVTGLAELGLDVNARAAIKILGRTLWSNRWAPVRFRSAFRWAGGVRLGEDLGVEPLTGGLQSQGAGQQEGGELGAGELGAGQQAASEEDGSFPLGELLEEIVSADPTEEHHEPAREGLTPDDALPFQWYKPRWDDNLYPRTIDIPGAIHPTQLERDAGPTIVSYPYHNTERSLCIGVNEDNWPRLGYRFQYVPDSREDREKNRLRNLLNRLGANLHGRLQVDHVQELQVGGEDCWPNLWPMDSSANESAGAMHLKQFRHFEQELGNIAGRWFQIVRVSLTPVADPGAVGAAQATGNRPTEWTTDCVPTGADCPVSLSGLGEGPGPDEPAPEESP